MNKVIECIKLASEKVRNNLLYIGVWVIALSTIIVINSVTKKSYSFVGVTTSKEMNVNLEHPVVIKSVNVLSGQSVRKGQLLLELQRPDLIFKMSDAQGRLDELMAQYKLNTRLNGNLKSLKKYKVTRMGKADEDLLGVQIKSVERELKSLLQEQEELYIFAKFDGFIGSVNYKKGESASPFQPIITIYHKTPSNIQGFIHEKISNEVMENRTVLVTSLNGNKKAKARILSIGSRVVEFPERFRRSEAEKIWGREVMIQLPEENNFLLGEKVFIEVEQGAAPKEARNRSIADQSEHLVLEEGYTKIEVSEEVLSAGRIEPSGLVYISELNKFMMISDDTKEDEALIYLLNKDGVIDSHILKVDGVKGVKDLESITADEKGNIFITSSQSLNKKGKVSKERRLLTKMRRSGVSLEKESDISLFSEFNRIAKESKHLPWVRLLKPESKSKYEVELDVEGTFVRAGDFYLGLRHPLGSDKRVTILKISNIEKALAEGRLDESQVSIWRTITLPITRTEDRNEGISGMHLEGDQLFILTANNGSQNSGRLFITKFSDKSFVKFVKRFDSHRPEGLSYDAAEKKLYIVFDSNNENDPLIMAVVALGDR